MIEVILDLSSIYMYIRTLLEDCIHITFLQPQHHGLPSTPITKDPTHRDKRMLHACCPRIRGRQGASSARPHDRILNAGGPREPGAGQRTIWLRHEGASTWPYPNRWAGSTLTTVTGVECLQGTGGGGYGVQVPVWFFLAADLPQTQSDTRQSRD